MTEAELAQAASNMYGLLVEPSVPLAELSKAALIGCQTLQGLVADQGFFDHVGFLSQLQMRYQNEFQSITGTKTRKLDHFRQFMSLERKLMVLGGLRVDLIDALTGQAERLIDEVRRGNRSISELHGTLFVLREKTCGLAEELLEKRRSKMKRNKLLGIAYALGGATIITINASPATVGDITLSSAGMAVSGAVGAVIIEKAWDLATK